MLASKETKIFYPALTKCPKCLNAVEVIGGEKFWVECPVCGYGTEYIYETAEVATTEWNKQIERNFGHGRCR